MTADSRDTSQEDNSRGKAQSDDRKATKATLVCEQGPGGWILGLGSSDDESATGADAIIEPLSIISGTAVVRGSWDKVAQDGKGLLAEGHAQRGDSTVRFTLRVDTQGAAEPMCLRWQVGFEGAAFTGAVIHSVSMPGETGDPKRLDLPSIHYAANTYGTGIFPRPDPRYGFAFRADRLAQPAIHYYTPDATWSYFAADEAPDQPQSELLYSLGIEPVGGGKDGVESDGEAGLRFFFRYPQREFGHRGDGGADAYVAKDLFAEGENREATWQPGDRLEKTLYLWRRPASLPQDYGSTARYLWRLAYPANKAPATSLLWWQAGQHIRWFNARLFNPQIAGGQYESPEGSGTAMLGFVEQSLLRASTTYNYASLALDCVTTPLPPKELHRLREQAAGAMTRWATDGRAQEGILYPACDKEGYFFGWRDYGDYENLTVKRDDAFDSIRLASEGRSLLSAASRARLSGDTSPDVTTWEDAAVAIGDWLREHPLPTGGYSSRYRRTGEALDPFAGGTGAALSLFCDCARLMYDRASRTAQSYLDAAQAAYKQAFAGMVRAGAFAGGTLDASTPDREAAVAALDACIQLYELTGDEQYLHDARVAADNLLSYMMVYPIRTFAAHTDAASMGISTFGSSIVSPENQHLDPVPTAPCLLLYGLYADDEVCRQAGVESLKWTLDGRWAIREADGLKQSEQLLHTRWYYNTFFTQRGDFRRGMPLWGRADSEHGWPQVVPSAALLGTGQVFVDWLTGRTAAVDGWRVESAHKEGDPLTGSVTLKLSAIPVPQEQQTGGLLLKVARLLPGSTLTLTCNGTPLAQSSSQLGHGCMLDARGSQYVTLSISLSTD